MIKHKDVASRVGLFLLGVAMALIKGTDAPDLNVKPILPDKHYLEGRIGSGDRIVFRVEGSTIYFMDVVKHDDIGRYGRRPRQARSAR